MKKINICRPDTNGLLKNREIRTNSFPNLDPHLKFFLQKSLNNLEEYSFYSVPRTRKIEPLPLSPERGKRSRVYKAKQQSA